MRAAILAGLAFAIVPLSSQQALFTAAAPVHVGRGSGTVIVADINGDRHADLLTNHLLAKALNIQLGDGRGGFKPGKSLSFDFDPAGPLLADFNEDGLLDLAITQGTRDIVHVLFGTGKAEFVKAAGSPYTVTDASEPYNKRTLHAVDINGDQHVDLVTANGRRRNTIGILFGNGRGGFSTGPEVAVDSGRDGYSVAFGDVNGDSHVDVVSASRAGFDDRGPGRVRVWFGDGRGGFTRSAQSPFSTSNGPRSTTLRDFDGDRRLDLAIVDHTGQLSLYRNDGAGGFAAAPGSPFRLGVETYFPIAEDVNGDGDVDLVLPNVTSVAVFLGGRAGFAPAPGSPYRAGPGAYGATMGDVNGDGRPDIVASSFEGESVTVLVRR